MKASSCQIYLLLCKIDKTLLRTKPKPKLTTNTKSMQAKTTPLLFLQDFAFKSNAAVLKTVMSFALLLNMVVSGYAQVYPNGESPLTNGFDLSYAIVESTPNSTQPFNAYKTNSRAQYLYLVSEFATTEVHTPAPLVHNTIRKIAFQMVTGMGVGSYTFKNFTVRLGYQTANIDQWSSDLMESHTDQNMITVFSPKDYTLTGIGVDGWAEIILDQPFDYDPALGHLVVEIAKTSPSSKPALNYLVKGYASYVNGMKMSRGCVTVGTGDATLGKDMYSSPNLTANTVAVELKREFRPNIKITYQGNYLNSNQEDYQVIGENICKEGSITVNLTNTYGTDISYQWQVNENGLTNPVWNNIPGATSSTYATTQNKELRQYRCKQTFVQPANTIGDRAITVYGVNTYKAGVWSNDNILIPGEAVRFADTTTYGDLDACRLYVDAAAVLTINENSKVSLAKKLKASEVQGKVILKDKSTLYQFTNEENENVDFTYQRVTPLLNRYDYTYYCSPTSGTTLGSVSPNTLPDKFFEYDDSQASKWVERAPAYTMKPGVGYIIRAPQFVAISGAPEHFTANFKGIPQNGDIPVPLTAAVGGYNLIGNPYPSAVSAKSFLQQYPSQLDGTIYYWTHSNPISSTPDANGIYQYSDNSYIAVNGLGTTAGVEKFRVASGQSFMVRSIGAITSATWRNSHREFAQDGIEFYKNQNNDLNVRAEIEPAGRIWLEIRGQQGKYQKMLIGFVDGATEEYDNGFDAEHMQASNLGFYSIAPNQQELGIMAKGIPFNDEQIIPIGFSTTAAGPLTIVKFLEDGFFKDKVVFLNDKLTNTLHNLSEGSYDFTSAAGTFNNRFVLAFKPKNITTVNPGIKPNTVVVFDKAEAVQLHSTTQNITNVVVYDMTGRILAKASNCDSVEVALSSIPRTNQLIVVEIHLENGSVETQKFQF